MSIGPKNESEKEVFAVERFRVDVQHCIYKVMRDAHMNQRELAHKLDLSEGRVSQFFSDECNITIRQLARIFFALGDEVALSSRRLEELKTGRDIAWTFSDGDEDEECSESASDRLSAAAA